MKKYIKTILKTCPMCNADYYMRLTEKQETQYNDYICYGGLVQDKMPDIDKFGREFIKSGYCPCCQEALFGTKLEDKSAYFTWAPDELDLGRAQEFMAATENMASCSEAILSEAAEKLSIADKVLFLYETELESEFYVDENGKVQER